MKIRKYKLKFMIILTLFLGISTLFAQVPVIIHDFSECDPAKIDEVLKDFFENLDDKEKGRSEKPKEFEKLEPLKANETLECEQNFPTSVLTIFKSNGTEKQVYYERLKISWGAYEISEDKKYMIFFWEEISDFGRRPLYYLDGNKGELKLIGNYQLRSPLDRTGKYLLYEKVRNSGEFAILNLQTGKVEKNLTWKLLNKEQWIEYAGIFYTLRATDNKYDFLIQLATEGLYPAKAHVSIKDNKIITEYDYTNLTPLEFLESEMRQRSKSP